MLAGKDMKSIDDIPLSLLLPLNTYININILLLLLTLRKYLPTGLGQRRIKARNKDL